MPNAFLNQAMIVWIMILQRGDVMIMKKNVKKYLFTLLLIVFSIEPVFAANGENWCSELNVLWRMCGYLLMAAYVLAPVMLIVTGTITLLKAIAQKDDGAVKKAQNILIRKTIAAVAVFLVITVTRVALSLVASDAQGQKGNWEECASCFLSPGDCK